MRLFGLPSRMAFVFLASAAFATAAPAATLTMEQSAAFGPVTLSGLAGTPAPGLTFRRFEETLGALLSVELSLSATLENFSISVTNPNQFDVYLKSSGKFDVEIGVTGGAMSGWMFGEEKKDGKRTLGAGATVGIAYTPLTVNSTLTSAGDGADLFAGAGDIAVSLGLHARPKIERQSVSGKCATAATETDRIACEAGLLASLVVASAANGVASGVLTLRYIYETPPPVSEQVTAAPIPAAGPLLAFAVSGLAMMRRRRLSRKA